MSFWGGVVSAAGALTGGLIGQSAADKANKENTKLQWEAMKHGILHKVRDAKSAGIHPLYALGASTYQPAASYSGASPLGESLANAGQDIGRAISSVQTKEQRQLTALQLASARADVEGKLIDNQIRSAQLKSVNPGNPSAPGSTNFIPGQGDSPVMKVNPSERSHHQPGRAAQQAGWVPDVGYARTDTGLAPIPSRDVKEQIEDQIIPETMWAIRNYMVPNLSFGRDGRPPISQLPKGATHWKWHYGKQEWQPGYGKESKFKLKGNYKNWSPKLKW